MAGRRGGSLGIGARLRMLVPAALTVLLAPALAQAQTPTPTSPFNSGDTAWMLTSMALALMMTIPGLTQFYGCAGTIVWTGVVTFLILMVCKFTTGLRVSEEDEVMGLDLALHGETIHD